jgi:hypothetical protein
MLSIRRAVAVGAALAVAVTGIAFADETPAQQPVGPAQMQEVMRQHNPQGMMPMHSGMQAGLMKPTMPGQDAFGAIQEIVRILEADPKSDWSKVDLEALRQHLIDMNEVTLRADAAAKPIEGGLEIAVTGSGRTLDAIQRMIPAWAQSTNGLNRWSTKAVPLANGELLTVTATDAKEIQHIRGLGYIGLLVSGSYHQMHHLAMAKGEFDHEHLGHTH